jgi:hypothetical protein
LLRCMSQQLADFVAEVGERKSWGSRVSGS